MRFKKGQIVRCKPGFLGNGETEPRSINPIYGGAAYVEGNVYTIRRISRGERSVVFFEECENGVFLDALESIKVEPTMYLSKFKFV